MKKRILKLLKNDLPAFILGGLVFGTVGVIAATTIASSQITYTNAKNPSVTNMEQALNDLYAKVKYWKSPLKCLTEEGAEMTCPSAANLQVGQRIAIGDQVFRYIRTTDTSDTTTQLNECADGSASIACSDGDARHPLADRQLRLLAEHNLNVGSNQYPDSTNPVNAGLQDSHVFGYKDGYTTYGNIAFGSSNSSYNASNVKTYIEAYANTLNTTYFSGENVVSGSAITKAEIMNLCSLSGSGTCANTYPWVYTTSYWSGSAFNSNVVWSVYSDGSFDFTYYSDNYTFGARAVISISASLI